MADCRVVAFAHLVRFLISSHRDGWWISTACWLTYSIKRRYNVTLVAKIRFVWHLHASQYRVEQVNVGGKQ